MQITLHFKMHILHLIKHMIHWEKQNKTVFIPRTARYIMKCNFAFLIKTYICFHRRAPGPDVINRTCGEGGPPCPPILCSAGSCSTSRPRLALNDHPIQSGLLRTLNHRTVFMELVITPFPAWRMQALGRRGACRALQCGVVETGPLTRPQTRV